MLLGLRHRVVALLERGESAAAFADMERFATIADALGQPLYSWYVPLWRGFRAQLSGDVPAILAAAAEAREVGGRVGSRNAATLAYVQESWAAGEEGRMAELLPRMMEMFGILPELAPDGTFYMALFPGQPDHVRRPALPRLGEILDQLHDDAEMLSGLCHAAVSLVEGRDEAEYCDVVHARLLPYAGLVAVDGIAAGTHGVVDRLLAMLALAAGRPEQAEEHARAALAGNERFGSRLHVAHAEGVLAGVLAARGALAEARQRYDRAQAELTAMGLHARAAWYASSYPVDAVEPVTPATEVPSLCGPPSSGPSASTAPPPHSPTARGSVTSPSCSPDPGGRCTCSTSTASLRRTPTSARCSTPAPGRSSPRGSLAWTRSSPTRRTTGERTPSPGCRRSARLCSRPSGPPTGWAAVPAGPAARPSAPAPG